MSNFYYQPKDAIVGKLVLSAQLINASPLIMGSGETAASEKDIIKLPNGQPYIPGSSIAGKLRTYYAAHQDQMGRDFHYFWGIEEEQENDEIKYQYQSHICFDDLLMENNEYILSVKDGVKINPQKGLAEKGAKYDYEVLEPGAIFAFRAEVTIRRRFDQERILQLTDLIGTILQADFRLGAFTQAGFGQMTCEDFQIQGFNFPVDAAAWFAYLEDPNRQGNIVKPQTALELIEPRMLQLDALFRIKKSLITSTYGTYKDQSDKMQAFRRKGPNTDQLEYVVSGKSIRGALRHRAIKILKTCEVAAAEDIIHQLFGQVFTDSQKEQTAIPSRIRIDECILQQVKPQKQTRIKIDRFTGGTIDGALMETEPVWSSSSENFRLRLRIDDCQTHEATLLLHLLKDLWIGDLPIGGEKSIGRGVLKGIKASLHFEQKTIKLKQTPSQLQINDPHDLLKHFKSLNRKPHEASTRKH